MPYKLRDSLSYCRVDDYLVFLDVEYDQYFRLPRNMERRFIAYMDGSEEPEFDIDDLIDRNILVDVKGAADSPPNSAIDGPFRSAMEQTSSIGNLRLAMLLDPVAIVFSTQLRLKTCRLKIVLDALAAYRKKRAPQPADPTFDPSEQRLLNSAAIFRQARLYVPIDTCCLLDSLSMTMFLARRGLHANIVFGVTGDPFAAHCWVQARDLVLNDTVGNAKAHTPIRVV